MPSFLSTALMLVKALSVLKPGLRNAWFFNVVSRTGSPQQTRTEAISQAAGSLLKTLHYCILRAPKRPQLLLHCLKGL
eukprot:2773639-Amphidinium_carterae.1